MLSRDALDPADDDASRSSIAGEGLAHAVDGSDEGDLCGVTLRRDLVVRVALAGAADEAAGRVAEDELGAWGRRARFAGPARVLEAGMVGAMTSCGWVLGGAEGEGEA